MARVYLDTSFVSACVTTRDDPASIVRRQTSSEWMETQRRNHDVFVSPEVIVEIDNPDFRGRDAAMAFIAAIPALAINDHVGGVAQTFVREHLMPSPANAGDAIHVAACCVHRIEYLLSWNVRHLANPNKTLHLQTICQRLGLIPPRIITPDLLWESS
jgi:hypothetical protein